MIYHSAFRPAFESRVRWEGVGGTGHVECLPDLANGYGSRAWEHLRRLTRAGGRAKLGAPRKCVPAIRN